MKSRFKKMAYTAVFSAISIVSGISQSYAADHGDGPLVSVQRSGDLGDVYSFLDPTNNKFLVAIMTTQGFIVPSEAVNFSVFDHNLKFQFEFETTGDAKHDRRIEVEFSQKKNSGSTPQTATITLLNGNKFTAPTTVSTLNNTSPQPVITNNKASDVSFFAGEADDPFFFDIPGFNRFVASVLGGSVNVNQLKRGRDSFAGYNTLAIALRIPVSLFGTVSGNSLGIAARVQKITGTPVRLDRMGVPAVNVALVPFPKKNAYNSALTQDDFATDIANTLNALGTNTNNINLLASLAISKGDFLRVNLKTANTGNGGGTNSGGGFPNGRRLQDDVIDTILNVVTNGGITTGDSVNKNESTFRNVFPFIAATHQPFAKGNIDDRTRN